MRTSIVVWSTLSGAIIGIFVDALAVGVVLAAGALLPAAVVTRFSGRWASVGAIAALALIPVVLSVLGYLEGQLKAS